MSWIQNPLWCHWIQVSSIQLEDRSMLTPFSHHFSACVNFNWLIMLIWLVWCWSMRLGLFGEEELPNQQVLLTSMMMSATLNLKKWTPTLTTLMNWENGYLPSQLVRWVASCPDKPWFVSIFPLARFKICTSITRALSKCWAVTSLRSLTYESALVTPSLRTCFYNLHKDSNPLLTRSCALSCF